MITLDGQPAYLGGARLCVGDYAPSVYVTNQDFQGVEIGGASGKYQLISVIPSIDGGVCQIQTKTFYKEISKYSNVDLIVICSDTPFAIKRFCVGDEANIFVLSDFRGKKFAKAYGLTLENTILEDMLTRAVILISPDGKIAYQEIVSEIGNEPDYAKALQALSNDL
ncbi:thiol peroxidase [Helicobacter muridarum]|uniref:Thiol peroxidase n=1 Tax=Helicobacter muridarum TaxID=216 RepID=A0A099TZN1_9HELI|nr:thiol peroxidase [Helicobacter muridarum]TLE00449.1 thiol peroxidase [Helicobacter muridarum]STQ86423.1 thiol peroxidase [Helicobacter muridarum]